MIKKVAHIAIAVKDISEAARFYCENLGLKVSGIEELPERKVKVAFLVVGDIKIELVEPTSSDSPIAKFLEERGPGLHHICFEVSSLEEELARLKELGVRLIDEVPRRGALGTKIAFIHPKATGGVLIELNQKEE